MPREGWKAGGLEGWKAEKVTLRRIRLSHESCRGQFLLEAYRAGMVVRAGTENTVQIKTIRGEID
jgi:hypothetical protein